MKAKKTTEQFIDESIKIHGTKYDYSITQYEKKSSPVSIICKIHGEFNQYPFNHLKGYGCQKCSGKYKYTQAEWIAMAIKIHGNKYDYSKVVFTNNKTNVCIVCPRHGEFYQLGYVHINGGSGCPKCASNSPTNDEWIYNAKQIHGDRYDYTNTVYSKSKDKLSIICPIHGEFLQRPRCHIKGKGCPKCCQSKSETVITKFLNTHNIEFIQEFRFSDCIHKLPLPFDFYIPSLNICIEYDGAFHYIPHWKVIDKYSSLKAIQHRDKIKTDYCHNNNIKLIRIHYKDFDKIEYILNEEILNK